MSEHTPLPDDNVADTTSTPDDTAPLGTSRLLGLPAELRLMIYEELLLQQNSQDIVTRDGSWYSRRRIIRPSILSVCQQIRQEMLGLYHRKLLLVLSVFIARAHIPVRCYESDHLAFERAGRTMYRIRRRQRYISALAEIGPVVELEESIDKEMASLTGISADSRGLEAPSFVSSAERFGRMWNSIAAQYGYPPRFIGEQLATRRS